MSDFGNWPVVIRIERAISELREAARTLHARGSIDPVSDTLQAAEVLEDSLYEMHRSSHGAKPHVHSVLRGFLLVALALVSCFTSNAQTAQPKKPAKPKVQVEKPECTPDPPAHAGVLAFSSGVFSNGIPMMCEGGKYVVDLKSMEVRDKAARLDAASFAALTVRRLTKEEAARLDNGINDRHYFQGFWTSTPGDSCAKHGALRVALIIQLRILGEDVSLLDMPLRCDERSSMDPYGEGNPLLIERVQKLIGAKDP